VQNLLTITQHAIDDLNDFSAHHLRLLISDTQNGTVDESDFKDNKHMDKSSEDIALTVRLVAEASGSTPHAELQTYASILDVYFTSNQMPSPSSTSSPLATFIANELQKVFTEEQAALAFLLSANNVQSTKTKVPSSDVHKMLSRRMTRSFKYAPTYHLTFSLFAATGAPSSWDVESALQVYMAPLLESLAPISNFTVDTQLQLYASFSPSIRQPDFNTEHHAWTLRKEDLSGFINAAEWPLSPSIGVGPTINFILYVPASDQSPLQIEENGGNSWLVPQWGGIQILNPSTGFESASIASALSVDDLRKTMYTFSHQLLSLLGIPESPSSLPIRLSTLTRVRAAHLIFSASSTLGALARLTKTLPSISIPDTVAKATSQTLSHLHQACNDLKDGRFHSALGHARVAEAEAERAFFERSMVGQVYFPDEHKVAVYLPLLGPVAVPLTMAALKELKAIRQKRSLTGA